MDQYINEVQKLNNSKSKNKLYFNKKMKIKFLAALASHVMSRVNIEKDFKLCSRPEILNYLRLENFMKYFILAN